MAQTTHLKKRVSIPLFFSATLGTLALGMLAGFFSGSKAGYDSLVLPPATPPDAVFPYVWGVLYVMIGIALFCILRTPAVNSELLTNKRVSTVLWCVQFGFNILWPFAFFTLELYTFSFVWLAALAAINLALIIYSFRVSNAAGWLLIPYEAWLLYAAYLNMFIAILN